MVATDAARRIRAIAAGLALAAIATAARADDRTLSWRALEVTARLDGAGRLHVRERHAMVFDGDWNGGERTFRLGLDQELDFEHIWREEPGAGGAPRLRELQEGDLSRVDHYDWADARRLRWRSRLPSDPPFAHQEIVYDLDYVLSGILVPQGKDGKSFLLDHDFAFPDREWPIEHFVADLELDPAWQAVRRPRHLEMGPLLPGQSATLSLPLRYVGAGKPAGVTTGPSRGMRLALVALLVALLPLPIVAMLRRERGLGRLGPSPAPAEIDDAWLEENVFRMAPELAGAAWDDQTGAAEVTAILARLELEGKIRSEVAKGSWPFSPPELHMQRLVPLASFAEGYERDLVSKLFFDGEQTSTADVRRHYRRKGFNPAAEISGLSRIAASAGGDQAPPRQSRWPALALFLAGLLLVAIGVHHHRLDFVAALAAVVPVGFLYLWSLGFARSWASRVDRLAVVALPWAISLVALATAAVMAILLDVPSLQLTTLVGYVLVCLAAWTSIAHQASVRQSAGHIALRRRLLAARHHFARELRSPQPRLRDAWVPWLIALGLGKVLDRWSVHHAGAGVGDGGVSTWSGGGGGGGVSTGGSAFSGGGGSFGGAGAAAAWSAAAAGMAAGVSAPSSSSSGGGGGGSSSGGSSSGGGGGGGW